jgi:hypothetical protein
MFTLIAEMSLADREKRLADANTAFGEAIDRLPDHLRHARSGSWNFEYALEDEKTSIGNRDIFGKKILETDSAVDPFDPAETNPFIDFLRRVVSKVASEAIDAEACEISFGDVLPEWPVFEAWRNELVGDNWLATQAIENRYVRLDAIPPELLGAEKRSEREAWLIDQIPSDERERLVEEHSAAIKSWEELGL